MLSEVCATSDTLRVDQLFLIRGNLGVIHVLNMLFYLILIVVLLNNLIKEWAKA